jgi:hypothetical protein
VIEFVDPNTGADHYNAECYDTAHNLGSGLTRLAESNNRVDRDEHNRKYRAEDADKQEAEDGVNPVPAFVGLLVGLLLHAPACPDTTMEDLGDLKADV